ncbi:MAG TPA: hypothetical protein C5S37_04100 [Methanophagales archaeon]|nr:hypothetical protein [Methanophagales archaeon]
MKMSERKIKLELDELIKSAQQQPGIADLMFVYGQYDEMLQKSREYLEGVKPKDIISTSSNSS